MSKETASVKKKKTTKKQHKKLPIGKAKEQQKLKKKLKK